MQLPVINHPDYVAKINDDNKFPIKKFGALADHLLKEKVVKKFFIPKVSLVLKLIIIKLPIFLLKLVFRERKKSKRK